MKAFSTLLFICCCVLTYGQEWEQLGNTPFLKHHSNGFGVNGKAYVFQGTSSESGTNILWEYDPATDDWDQLDNFAGPARSFAIGDDLDGKYYFGFGRNATGALSDLWVFDPADMSFTELASCPCPGRAHPALVAINGKVFMGSGSSDFGDLNDWWVYDISTDTWSEKDNIPGPVRHHPYQFYIGDMVYVGGGHIDNWLSFNPATDEWTTIDDLPRGRVAGTQFSHEGYGYLLAGDDAAHVSLDDDVTFMRYDAVEDSWEYLPPLPNGTRWAPSSFIIDDMLYFFGGMFGPRNNDRSVWRLNLNELNGVVSSNKDIIADSEKLSLFPNPVQDALNIELEDFYTGELELTIYSAEGMLVKKDMLRSGKVKIDVNELSKGNYLLMINTETKVYRSSFSKL